MGKIDNADKRINREITKIKRIYEKKENGEKTLLVEQNVIKSMDGIIKNAAFCRVVCDDLMDDIAENGTMEDFVNGSQQFLRERPQVKTYLSTVKMYAALMKQMISMLPPKQQEEPANAVNEFQARAQAIRMVK